MSIRFIVLVSFLCVAQSVAPLKADWINLTGAETANNIAEIYIFDDHVKLVLEIFVDDFGIFEELMPDDWMQDINADRPALTKRLHAFSSRKFQFVTDGGEKLTAKLNLAEPRIRIDRQFPFEGMIHPISQLPVPGPPADRRVLYVELIYPFKEKPKALTIIPPLDDKGNIRVNIGFIAYHKTVPIIDFRYLSASEKLILDWGDPWYSIFHNPNLKRHHKDALMSFLYVEPRVVRHEGLMRVRDLQKWVDLNVDNETMLSDKDIMQIKGLASDFFIKRNPLIIDGEKSLPSSFRAEFLKVTSVGLRTVNEEELLDPTTAIIGVTQSHWVKHLPQNVIIDWNLFNDRINKVPYTVTDPAGPLPGFITKEDATIEWNNFLHTYKEPNLLPIKLHDGRSYSVPILSLFLFLISLVLIVLLLRSKRRAPIMLCGLSIACLIMAALMKHVAIVDIKNPIPGPPTNVAAMQIATSILTHVRFAFLEKEPASLHHALDGIIENDKFNDIVSELKRAFEIDVTSGGTASVDSIKNLTLENTSILEGNDGFRTLANWTVLANARHWGHVDQRTIRFRALIEFAEVNGIWKLADLTVLDVKPVN